MVIALRILGVLVLIIAALAIYGYRSADRSGDDFGGAILAVFGAIIASVLAVIWVLLFLIHIWP